MPTTSIRSSVFETNSSSSHSLTISRDEISPSPFPQEILRAGEVTIPVKEYGWDWERLYRTENKLSYLLTYATDGRLPEGLDDPQSLTRELRAQNDKVDMLCRVVEEHTGCRMVIPPGSGYVDHQSQGVGGEAFVSEDALRAFLFSPSSYVEIGNDNSPPPPIMPNDLDRRELTYPDLIKDPPKNPKLVTIRVCPDLATPLGPTNERLDRRLLERFKDAVVVKAHVEKASPHVAYERDPVDRKLYAMLNRSPMKAAPDLPVTSTLKKCENYSSAYEYAVLTIAVTQESAKRAARKKRP